MAIIATPWNDVKTNLLINVQITEVILLFQGLDIMQVLLLCLISCMKKCCFLTMTMCFPSIEGILGEAQASGPIRDGDADGVSIHYKLLRVIPFSLELFIVCLNKCNGKDKCSYWPSWATRMLGTKRFSTFSWLMQMHPVPISLRKYWFCSISD